MGFYGNGIYVGIAGEGTSPLRGLALNLRKSCRKICIRVDNPQATIERIYFMLAFITWLGSIFSIIGVGISLMGKSSAAKFRAYKKTGEDMKESKQLGKAMLCYKKALDHSETGEQEAEIWFLIIHIHTDRLIGASEKYNACAGRVLEWHLGPNNIPSNYNRPPRKELLR